MGVHSKNKGNWVDVKGFEDLYEISDLGCVYSKSRLDSLNRKQGGKYLKNIKGTHGYYYVNLWKDGNCYKKTIHQLVAIAFLNHNPDGFKLVVDHINDDKLDNKVSNLRLVSNRENSTKKSRGVSNFVGVSRMGNKWRANLRIKGDLIYLGSYNTEVEASNAYNNKLKSIRNAIK